MAEKQYYRPVVGSGFFYGFHVVHGNAAAHLAVGDMQQLYGLHEIVGKLTVETTLYFQAFFGCFVGIRFGQVSAHDVYSVVHAMVKDHVQQITEPVQNTKRQPRQWSEQSHVHVVF